MIFEAHAKGIDVNPQIACDAPEIISGLAASARVEAAVNNREHRINRDGTALFQWHALIGKSRYLPGTRGEAKIAEANK